MGRRAILAVVAAVAVLSAGIGWVAGQRIKSPAEIAAEQEPPEPSLITVPVERRVLSQNVVVRGTVRSSDAAEISVSSLESTIITRLVKTAGEEVDEGDVVIEVAGRPLIVLQGELPVFRNLIPTLEGPDVRQLEAALDRLGYDSGEIDGTYTASTAEAVADLYRDLGYSPVDEGESLQAAARAARETVVAQQVVLADARKALADAQSGLPASQKLQLEQGLNEAMTQLTLTTGSANIAKDSAAAAVTEAEVAKTAADQAAATAADRLSQANGGTHPDTAAPPTAEELAELEAENTAAQAAATSAAAAVTAAIANRDQTNIEQDAAVASAQANVEIQQAVYDEAIAGAETDALQRSVNDALSALASAQGDLADAQAQVGARVLASEIVFLPSLPRAVQNLTVEVGDIPTGPVMTLSGAGAVVESGLPAADRRLVEVGTTAKLEDDGLGVSVDAEITFVADNPGGLDLSADRYAMRLRPLDELPEDALNVNLRISIPISTSGGEVLAVPFAALSAGADGSARVEVERATGETTLVKVATGLRAEGFVEIDPIDGDIDEGDRVVVGRDLELQVSEAEADDGPEDEADEGSS